VLNRTRVARKKRTQTRGSSRVRLSTSVNQPLAASSPILVGKRRVSEVKQCENWGQNSAIFAEEQYVIRYVITVFVKALALGASTSLHASPPNGAVVQTWSYDPRTNTVTLKIVNTSHKDITAFNIAIKETYANGHVEEHEMLEELVGKIVR